MLVQLVLVSLVYEDDFQCSCRHNFSMGSVSPMIIIITAVVGTASVWLATMMSVDNNFLFYGKTISTKIPAYADTLYLSILRQRLNH